MSAPLTLPGERLHALDAVRAFALLGGIVLHGTLSFFAGLPAQDVSQSQTLGLLFYVIHVFRMSLFYMVTGFFAALSLQRKGENRFIQDRTRRILVPMLVGWLILLPLTGLPLLWGLERTYGDNLPVLVTQALSSLPLLHLWFLYYLLWFYAAVLLWYRIVPLLPQAQQRASAMGQALTTRLWGPVILAMPCAAILLGYTDWNPWFGVPTPERGLRLELSATVIYGLAFFTGVLAFNQRQVFSTWQHGHRIYLLLAIMLTIMCLALAGINAELFNPRYFSGTPWLKSCYAFLYCAALWYWCFGITGWALVTFKHTNARIRYLADAS